MTPVPFPEFDRLPEFYLTAGELINRLSSLPPGTLIGLYPQEGGGTYLMTARNDDGDYEADHVIWYDLT